MGNKKQVLNILRENETYKAMKRSTRKNLFDPHYTYKLSEEGFDRDTSKWAKDQQNAFNRKICGQICRTSKKRNNDPGGK